MTRGRRPGLFWRIAIVSGALTVFWLAIIQGTTAIFGPDYDRVGHLVSAMAATALTVPLVVLARRFLDQRPWAGLRLMPPRTGWRSLLLGMVCYLVPAALGIVGSIALGWTQLSLHTPVGELLLITAGLLALVFLYEAFPEELVFRGYVYRNLSAAFAPWLALIGQAALFALWGAVLWAIASGVSAALDRLVLFFGIAAVIGIFRVVTGDVWACIGFHLAFQTVQQLVGPNWGQVTATVPQVAEQVAFGLVPLALAVPLLLVIHRGRVNWHDWEPDPDGAALQSGPRTSAPLGRRG